MLYWTLNASVKLLTAVAIFTPSLALNVRLNVPACAVFVEGVIVNTFVLDPVPCVTVAILPDVSEAILKVIGSHSGSVAVIVTVVAVPSLAKSYVALAPLILGVVLISAMLYQPDPFHKYRRLLPETYA